MLLESLPSLCPFGAGSVNAIRISQAWQRPGKERDAEGLEPAGSVLSQQALALSVNLSVSWSQVGGPGHISTVTTSWIHWVNHCPLRLRHYNSLACPPVPRNTSTDQCQ